MGGIACGERDEAAIVYPSSAVALPAVALPAIELPAQVADFGLSKLASSQPLAISVKGQGVRMMKRRQTASVGTFSHMAPELRRGECELCTL